jgi:hypothetical protein
VIQGFQDYDRHDHPVGESWTFLDHSFAAYDDGMTFFVSLDGENEWLMHLQWRPESQGDVLTFLKDYVAPAT